MVFRKHDQPYMEVCQAPSTDLLFTTGAVPWFIPPIKIAPMMEILINLFFCCSTCRNHHPVPYLFMTCDRIFKNIGATTIEAIKVHLWFLVGFSVLNLEFSV